MGGVCHSLMFFFGGEGVIRFEFVVALLNAAVIVEWK